MRRVDVSLAFVDKHVINAVTNKTFKITCSGDYTLSDWHKTTASCYHMKIPIIGNLANIHVDICKTTKIVRVWATSDTINMNINVHFPVNVGHNNVDLVDIDAITADYNYENEIVLRIPHMNKAKWWTLKVALYNAGLDADEQSWNTTWNGMIALALAEIPRKFAERGNLINRIF